MKEVTAENLSAVYFSFFLVEIPNGKYKGQKLIKLVRIKTPARIMSTNATVPEI
jgi:hypothetical protein